MLMRPDHYSSVLRERNVPEGDVSDENSVGNPGDSSEEEVEVQGIDYTPLERLQHPRRYHRPPNHLQRNPPEHGELISGRAATGTTVPRQCSRDGFR
jgi:hypothetical protein